MLNLLKETLREWREDGATRLAAALAYYTTFSLAPLLVLVIAIAGLVGGQEAAQTQTMAQVQDLLGAEGREFIEGMIESASQPDFWLGLINFVVSFLVITLLLAMIFKFLPEINIAWRDVWLGAAVTSALFSLGKFLETCS
jgi:membrane protein